MLTWIGFTDYQASTNEELEKANLNVEREISSLQESRAEVEVCFTGINCVASCDYFVFISHLTSLKCCFFFLMVMIMDYS